LKYKANTGIRDRMKYGKHLKHYLHALFNVHY
jgi:hypothetical protein